MRKLKVAKSGYDFLETFGKEQPSAHTTAPWLLNDFSGNQWKIQTSQKAPVNLDWGVHLWDGSLLTDGENDVLLRSLKHLLIIGGNGMNEEFAMLAPTTVYMRVTYTLKLIDYLLIHAQSYGLVEFGLGSLDTDHLKGMLNHLASEARSEDSVYAWKDRVSAFSASELSKLTPSEELALFKKYPSMMEVSDDELEDFPLDIEASEIPRVRAALMKAGVYYGNRNHGFRISTKQLSELIYSDTLRGCQTQKSALHALTFYPLERSYRREFPSVRVTTGESERLQQSIYFYYRYTLIGSAALGPLGLPSPSDIETIKDYMPDLNESKRFRSVPSANLLKLFRRSMEFHVEKGRMILNGFVRVAAYCKSKGLSMTQLPEAEFLNVIGPELVSLGVKKLGLSSNRRTKNRSPRKGSREKYFEDLRANHGLLELVYVYLGSIQMTVGMLMARRIDELVTLKARECLDGSKSWLIFGLAKSTRKALGMRQRESRPIDAIAVEMIEELRRFQKLLRLPKIIDDLGDLYATPSSLGHAGLQDCSIHLYNRHLDFACDYFESDLNDDGQRYYVRQHQLRRFFAIMFFYTNSFGELDTLRWMLGHRDIEHVWHYLTECLDPSDIRGAGARYFADQAKKDRLENYQSLKDLLAARFGTTSFKLVDEQEIESYLEAMLEEGKARIEPHFYNDENGKAMKVLFIVS